MSCTLTDAFVSFRPAASHGADGSRRGSAVGWHADTNADHAGGADTDARTGTAKSARREKTAYGLHLSKLQRCRKEVAKILFMKAFLKKKICATWVKILSQYFSIPFDISNNEEWSAFIIQEFM